MATKTSKQIIVENIADRRGNASRYNLEIIPGKSIRIYGLKVVGTKPSGHYQITHMLQRVSDWFAAMSQEDRDALASLHADNFGVAGDWIEDHGGDRKWVGDINVIEKHDNIEVPFERAFRMGDQAEYHSFNYSYWGPILGITGKTVQIKDRTYGNTRRRLSLYEFCWRNWDFDLTKAQQEFFNYMD